MTKEAWKRQKELQLKYRMDDVPDINELITIIDSLKSERDRALFAMYYLTGCRLSEITICKTLRKTVYNKETNKQIITEIIDHNYPGIKKRDITFDIIDEKECMNIRTENRKNSKRKTKKVPIPISLELPIVNYVKHYLNTISDDDYLFPFGPKRATQIINKTGFNAHFIRHIRATHLVTKYNFNDQILVQFMGWANSLPAQHYMELKTNNMFRQFYQNE